MTAETFLLRARRAFTPALAIPVLCALAFCGPSLSRADNINNLPDRKAPFSTITVIGDSLSDTGRTFSLIGIPPPPYYQGRLSNGPLWIEYLSPALRLSYQPLDNYSWAGANTGRLNAFGAGLPGMLDELDEFLAPLRHRADKKALYVVFGGANDFFRILVGGEDPSVVIPQAIANLHQIVTTLHTAGAENILVVDLPDIGLTPRARAGGPATMAGATYLSVMFNSLLNQTLDSLEFPVMRASTFALLNAIVADPAAFGITNVTGQGISDPAHAETYLFWDDIHPTTRVQEVLAGVIFDELAEAGLLKQLLKHP